MLEKISFTLVMVGLVGAFLSPALTEDFPGDPFYNQFDTLDKKAWGVFKWSFLMVIAGGILFLA